MQIREDENLPSAATTAVARVLGQKIKSESGRDEQKKKRFFCKGLREILTDRHLILGLLHLQ